jgi:Mg2+ and Co2+ transporter CorA
MSVILKKVKSSSVIYPYVDHIIKGVSEMVKRTTEDSSNIEDIIAEMNGVLVKSHAY